MSGQKIGLWTVLEQDGNKPGGAALWRCRCDCGEIRVVAGSDLRSGKSLSCGCEGSRTKIGELTRTHGQTGTRLYECWKNMRARCANVADPDYGGRGISVCAEWECFSTFQSWALQAGYTDSLTIERLDVNSGYSPKNCCWADDQAQSENRRFVAKRDDGRLWWHVAKDNGISNSAYRTRLNDGWTHSEAATWPMHKKRRDGNLKRANYVMLHGEKLPITLAAKAIGYSPAAIYQRAKRKGISLQAALTEME